MKKIDIKRLISAGLVLTMCLQGLTACGSGDASSSKYQNNGNSVEEALNEQMAKEDAESSSEALPETLVVPPSEKTESTTEQPVFEQVDEEKAKELFGSGESYDPNAATTEATTEVRPEVDTDDLKNTDVIDLTAMDSNMVYSTVYQMMADAPSYVGKKVRMKGSYYSSYDETTKQRYYFIIIQDAAACCQQGLEFVWGDGSHTFPDEYPEDGTEAVVEGTFETYKDNPDDQYEYIHLVDSTFEVASEPAN